jgi:DNA-binding transcriptional MerR regulator
MNISSLAKATGTTADTLRYYEKLGLLDEPQRAENGYRRYDELHISRVRFIRSAQSLGFSLAEIGSIIPQMTAGQFGRTQIEEGLRKKIGQIDTHIKELQRLKKDLQSTFNMLTCERNANFSESSASLPTGSARKKMRSFFAN